MSDENQAHERSLTEFSMLDEHIGYCLSAEPCGDEWVDEVMGSTGMNLEDLVGSAEEEEEESMHYQFGPDLRADELMGSVNGVNRIEGLCEQDMRPNQFSCSPSIGSADASSATREVTDYPQEHTVERIQQYSMESSGEVVEPRRQHASPTEFLAFPLGSSCVGPSIIRYEKVLNPEEVWPKLDRISSGSNSKTEIYLCYPPEPTTEGYFYGRGSGRLGGPAGANFGGPQSGTILLMNDGERGILSVSGRHSGYKDQLGNPAPMERVWRIQRKKPDNGMDGAWATVKVKAPSRWKVTSKEDEVTVFRDSKISLFIFKHIFYADVLY